MGIFKGKLMPGCFPQTHTDEAVIKKEEEKETYKISDYLKVKEAAKFLGVAAHTLRAYEEYGFFKTRRNPLNGYRLYLKKELVDFLEKIKSGHDFKTLRTVKGVIVEKRNEEMREKRERINKLRKERRERIEKRGC